MFASLKNKIKEETGNEIPTLSQPLPPSSLQSPPPPLSSSSSSSNSTATTITTTTSSTRHHNQQNGNRYTNLRGSRLSSTTSVTSIDDQIIEQKDTEINTLRTQCNELQNEIKDLKQRLDNQIKENERLEKTNEILLESVKVAQNQKDLISEEQEKIQNIQQAEISKLKSLLSFREQEGYDQLSKIKQYQQQIENLTTELERLKLIEPAVEDLQDELERFRHASQLDKNNLTTTLAAVEEENRHLKTRLQIVDQSRLESILSLSSNEKVQALIQERKLLEQHLEEAHLQLSDIKSSWSGQNLALETQVSRLSRQVAEETTEKRKALQSRDEYAEKIKQIEFELQKSNEEIEQRNTKIKLLEEEIDELTSTSRDYREESEEQILYLKNQAESLNQEIDDLKLRLKTADERLNDYVENSENIIKMLRLQLTKLQDELNELKIIFDKEIQEKNIALLRNAEISQNEEILKKELRIERDECNELQDKLNELNNELKEKDINIKLLNDNLNELNNIIKNQNDRIIKNEQLNHEISEKNKTIKILNQRLLDLKKTLQQEIKSSNSNQNEQIILNNLSTSSTSSSSILITTTTNDNNIKKYEYRNSNGNTDGPIVMDEVNFKYLKHVIVKFLTSREVEARHLIRAVATLLHLTHEEEKLLHDTLNWKMSWFGSKPDHGTGQNAFSIPPS